MNVGLIKNVGQKVLIGAGLTLGALGVSAATASFVVGGFEKMGQDLEKNKAKLVNMMRQQPQADTFQKNNI